MVEKCEYLDLYSIVKKDGKIVGYVFYQIHLGVYEYRKLSDIDKYINYVVKGKKTNRGYLKITGRKLEDIPVESLSRVREYVYMS